MAKNDEGMELVFDDGSGNADASRKPGDKSGKPGDPAPKTPKLTEKSGKLTTAGVREAQTRFAKLEKPLLQLMADLGCTAEAIKTAVAPLVEEALRAMHVAGKNVEHMRAYTWADTAAIEAVTGKPVAPPAMMDAAGALTDEGKLKVRLWFLEGKSPQEIKAAVLAEAKRTLTDRELNAALDGHRASRIRQMVAGGEITDLNDVWTKACADPHDTADAREVREALAITDDAEWDAMLAEAKRRLRGKITPPPPPVPPVGSDGNLTPAGVSHVQGRFAAGAKFLELFVIPGAPQPPNPGSVRDAIKALVSARLHALHAGAATMGTMVEATGWSVPEISTELGLAPAATTDPPLINGGGTLTAAGQVRALLLWDAGGVTAPQLRAQLGCTRDSLNATLKGHRVERIQKLAREGKELDEIMDETWADDAEIKSALTLDGTQLKRAKERVERRRLGKFAPRRTPRSLIATGVALVVGLLVLWVWYSTTDTYKLRAAQATEYVAETTALQTALKEAKTPPTGKKGLDDLKKDVERVKTLDPAFFGKTVSHPDIPADLSARMKTQDLTPLAKRFEDEGSVSEAEMKRWETALGDKENEGAGWKLKWANTWLSVTTERAKVKAAVESIKSTIATLSDPSHPLQKRLALIDEALNKAKAVDLASEVAKIEAEVTGLFPRLDVLDAALAELLGIESCLFGSVCNRPDDPGNIPNRLAADSVYPRAVLIWKEGFAARDSWAQTLATVRAEVDWCSHQKTNPAVRGEVWTKLGTSKTALASLESMTSPFQTRLVSLRQLWAAVIAVTDVPPHTFTERYAGELDAKATQVAQQTGAGKVEILADALKGVSVEDLRKTQVETQLRAAFPWVKEPNSQLGLGSNSTFGAIMTARPANLNGFMTFVYAIECFTQKDIDLTTDAVKDYVTWLEIVPPDYPFHVDENFTSDRNEALEIVRKGFKRERLQQVETAWKRYKERYP